MSSSEIEIVLYSDQLAPAFAELNYAWIRQSYEVEAHDRVVLDTPFESIIQNGGQIFFALDSGAAVGTLALINSSACSYELAKMAVAETCRGRGVGATLLEAAIQYAAASGKVEVILESNTRQVEALHLYRKFGFEEIPLDPNSAYSRANIRMRLAIDGPNM